MMMPHTPISLGRSNMKSYMKKITKIVSSFVLRISVNITQNRLYKQGGSKSSGFGLWVKKVKQKSGINKDLKTRGSLGSRGTQIA